VTVTVSANSTVIVGVGTTVVGVGAGGFFIVNGTNGTRFPIVGGIEAAIELGASGLEAVFAAFAGEEAEEEEEEEELEETSTITLSTLTSSLTTSSSTSSSATSTPSTPSSYLIFPKDGSNRIANANFERRLQGLSQLGSIYDIPLGNGVVFWVANLTTYNASKVQQDSYVSIA
jgi:hypothetical protein